jgi:uncharacterized protein YcbK (DUF882 family)
LTGQTASSPRPLPRAIRRCVALASLGAVFAVVSVNATQDAIANGGTRTLTIYHAHTKEQETVTFKSFGSYNSAGLQKLNWLLRDWRQDEPTRMDPQLFDILWEVYRASGSSSPIHVVSAYRSPGTNAMLARRSRGVAKNSQHMSGKAMDFNLPDVSMSTVRDIGLRLQNGGVGYYPRANNPWVHLDTGGVRHWPKVSREHLVRLFPDERTVHIPRDGRPLAGFETARAIIEARGGAVSSGYIDIAEGRATGRSLFQILFGGGEGDDEGEVVAGRGKKGRTAVASRGRNTQTAALPADSGSEGNPMAFFSQPNATTTVAARQEAPALRPSRPTRPTPIEEPKPATPEAKPAEQPKPAEQAKPVEMAAAQPPRGPQPAAVTRTDAEEEDAGKRVMVQLPPRRPANFGELVAATSGKPTLVTVQLPPQRPTALASIEPSAPVPAQPQAAPQPQAPAAVQASAPQRAAPAPATPATVVGLRSDPLPAATSAYAPQAAMPAGRIIPAAPPTPRAAAPAQPAAVEGKDRKALDSLISQVAARSSTQVAPVAAPSVSAISSVRTVTGRFEAKAAEQSSEGVFTGSAIRPLNQGFR